MNDSHSYRRLFGPIDSLVTSIRKRMTIICSTHTQIHTYYDVFGQNLLFMSCLSRIQIKFLSRCRLEGKRSPTVNTAAPLPVHYCIKLQTSECTEETLGHDEAKVLWSKRC